MSEAKLSVEEEEWLIRACGKAPGASAIPAAMVDALVAAELGKTNLSGTFEITAAGRRYLEERNLQPKARKRRR